MAGAGIEWHFHMLVDVLKGNFLPRVLFPFKDNQITRKSCCRCYKCGATDPSLWPGSCFNPVFVGLGDGSSFSCFSPASIWNQPSRKLLCFFYVRGRGPCLFCPPPISTSFALSLPLCRRQAVGENFAGATGFFKFGTNNIYQNM